MNDQNKNMNWDSEQITKREVRFIPSNIGSLIVAAYMGELCPPAAHNNPALTSEGVLKESIAETMEATGSAPCSEDPEFITSKTSSETPRTDHVCAVSYREADLERLCRELERQNNALRAQSASDAHWLTVLREQIERE